jgi:putative transposase
MDAIAQRFEALNPYDPVAVPGSILKIELDFSRPGKPTDNAFIESFNASVRKELLNTRWFANLQEARQAARSWLREYNEDRPHRSLSNKTPQAFAASAKEARSLEKSHSPLA